MLMYKKDIKKKVYIAPIVKKTTDTIGTSDCCRI